MTVRLERLAHLLVGEPKGFDAVVEPDLAELSPYATSGIGSNRSTSANAVCAA
ncbi:MAG: hypothetical protein WBM75_05280 [Polyangiales bacterium]